MQPERQPLHATARARSVSMGARKVRRVADLVRGKPADEALTMLRFVEQSASLPVYKVIASAMANAEHNLDLDPSTLWVSGIWVDQARPFGRKFGIRERAQGRAYKVQNHACHITVEVESRPAVTQRERRTGAKRRAR